MSSPFSQQKRDQIFQLRFMIVKSDTTMSHFGQPGRKSARMLEKVPLWVTFLKPIKRDKHFTLHCIFSVNLLTGIFMIVN